MPDRFIFIEPAPGTFDPVCTAITGVSADVMARIVDFYIPRGRVLDMTYNTGAFWRKANLEHIDLLGVDIDPKYGPDVVADNALLPFRSATFDACVFDPPFGTGSTKPQTIGTVGTYNLRPHAVFQDIFEAYKDGIEEAQRVLRPGGSLVVKCQDVINGGRYQPLHYRIMLFAEFIGLVPVMTFVLIRTGKPIMRHSYQKNPRSNYSYFLVFRKGRTTRERMKQGGYSLDEGNVKRHTLDRLNSFVDAITGKRITYQELIA